MQAKSADVISIAHLAHGFMQITLMNDDNDDFLPGHYLYLEQQWPCYIQDFQSQTFSIIVTPAFAEIFVHQKSITISEAQGQPLPVPTVGKSLVLVAENEGINAVLFYGKKYRQALNGLILIGITAQYQFPFEPSPSQFLIPDLPSHVFATLPLLEDWGIPTRLASVMGKPGCYEGEVLELAMLWLANHEAQLVRIPTLTLQR